MLTDFTIDETFIGQTIGPANAYLVNLSRTQAPTRYEIPDWDPGRQCWKTARFVLRGSGDFRDLCCIDAQSDGGWGGSGTGFVLGHASISYRGELEVRCVPKGSQWKVTVQRYSLCSRAAAVAAGGPRRDLPARHPRARARVREAIGSAPRSRQLSGLNLTQAPCEAASDASSGVFRPASRQVA